jgi:glycosyltransferase involved in cell wall biosynthesis
VRTRDIRVATLAHGHPRLNAGGAEIAAHTLHRSLAEVSGVETLHLSPGPRSMIVGPNEHLFAAPGLDPFLHSNIDGDLGDLIARLRAFAPDVVHLHHILGFGTGVLFAIRAALPNAAIVLTFHEYIPICHNQGQMVETGGELCEGASPERCHACFPDIAAGRFLRRERALKAALSLCDGYIAPSAFLAQRYTEWGLDPRRIAVLENAIASIAIAKLSDEPREIRGRFAFFGQITSFKGVDVLLEAVASIPDEDWIGSTLHIYGNNLERQPESFRERVTGLLSATAGRVDLRGPYSNESLPDLMANADWVVVPSIWWENSPVVIQEAFRSGRPVIASNIGGMAEKVRHGVDGLHFRARDAKSLAARLVEARDPALWSRLRGGIRPPAAPADAAAAHLQHYRSLLALRRSTRKRAAAG